MVTRIWIDEGSCICCQACVQACTEVFALPDGHAIVRGEMRQDGLDDTNQARSALRDGVADSFGEAISEAAAGCPVDIIHLDA